MKVRRTFEKGKTRGKGAVVLSETLLSATEVIISFVIIVLVVQLVFQQQSSTTISSAYDTVARDISTSIDRVAAAAGSIYIEQPIPKGLSLNLTVDYKTVIVSYGNINVRKSFVGLINTNPVMITNPTDLCIAKTENDGKIYVMAGNCTCNPSSSICNPVCSIKGICQNSCVTNKRDDVCNPACLSKDLVQKICDPDCYRNVTDKVFNPYCLDSNNNPDGVCDPDSNNIQKGLCSKTCYMSYSNGNTGVCDPDCPPKEDLYVQDNVTYKKSDGYCYTGCINKSSNVVTPSQSPSPLKGPCPASDIHNVYTTSPGGSDLQCLGNDIWSCGEDVLSCFSCFQPCTFDSGNSIIKTENLTYLNACCTHTVNATQNQVHDTDSVCCCQYNGGSCSITSRSLCVQSGSYAFPSSSQYCQQSSSISLPPAPITNCDAANQTNWHCLVVSKSNNYASTNYSDYVNQIWACGDVYTNCLGQLCDENSTIKSFGNILCHVMNVDPAMFPQAPVCCCVGNNCGQITRGQCLTQGGNIYNSTDSRCAGSNSLINPTPGQPTQTNKITLVSDGICDLDCNATSNICDPDCPNSPACQNQCTGEGQKSNGLQCCSGLIHCPGTDVCTKYTGPLSCCGNGVCEGPGVWSPANKTQWETSYTCPNDCGSATEPACKPGGPFVSSVCYSDVTNQAGTRTGDKPAWSGNAISVCDPQAKLYLDRRSWDINQVFASVLQNPPGGFAFDASRYINACQRVQPAGYTISANENYTSSSPTCCSLDGTGCPFPDAPFLGQDCAGVGYCADHAAAMLSILRTLGIPPQDVFITFEIQGANCGRHAFVVMKCDPNLKSSPSMWPNACNGNEGQWIGVDATRHFITLLKNVPCVSLGIFWNDMGIYPLTYGSATYFPNLAVPQGQIPQGYVIPPDAICNTYNELTPQQCMSQFSVQHDYQDLCSPYNVNCIVPSGLPQSQ